MKQRVGITGVGVVSPLGLTVEQNWDCLCRREHGISRHEFQGREALPHCNCGRIKDFDPEALISSKKLLKLMNRESQLAFLAAQQALEHSGILRSCSRERMGAYLGTGLTAGDLETIVSIVENSMDTDGKFSYALLGTSALARCNPLLSFRILPNMAMSYISIAHGIQGPNMVFNPWPGNTVQAILEAKRSIESGEIDCALAGGCDAKCNYVSFLTLSQLGLLSSSGVAKPFSPQSDGIVPGEGAACVVLESFEHAASREARILAELCGGACVTDSESRELYPAGPDLPASVMRDALDGAAIHSSRIDLVCTSANSHPAGDENELQALGRIFGTHSPALAALSEFTGELVAAGPAYALAMCAYSILRGQSLPCPAGRADGALRETRVRAALVNAFSLGTAKACMVLRHASAE